MRDKEGPRLVSASVADRAPMRRHRRSTRPSADVLATSRPWISTPTSDVATVTLLPVGAPSILVH